MERIREYTNMEAMLQTAVWSTKDKSEFLVTGLNLSGHKYIDSLERNFTTFTGALMYAISSIEEPITK